MEFNQKLQELRKRKGLTQEQLGEVLFVSRTAISKWESGRGYPNIDSLKQIANFFEVSIDELLSCDELLTVAEKDGQLKENRFRDLFFGLIDTCFILLFFLPFFGQKNGGVVNEVSLIQLTGIKVHFKIIYIGMLSLSVAIGLLTLIFTNFNVDFWHKYKRKLSLIINAVSVIVFSFTLQPYASVLTFVFLMIKVLILIKV